MTELGDSLFVHDAMQQECMCIGCIMEYTIVTLVTMYVTCA